MRIAPEILTLALRRMLEAAQRGEACPPLEVLTAPAE